MIALANTVRQGKRLSFWNTKPRSPPGPRTARPSSATSPELAGSRPATMRRNVVLPQPEGPTTAMNSPRSTARLMSCSACNSPNVLPRWEIWSLRAIAALVLGPGHESILEPPEARGERNPGGGEHDHAGKQLRHVEGVRRLRDQPPEARARAKQLRHHHPDQPASYPELEPGEDEGHGGRQRHLEENLPRRRAERAQHFDEPLAGGAQAGLGVDGHRKQHQEDDHQHLRPDADPEPKNEQWGECDRRGRVKARDPGLQYALHGGAFGHSEAGKYPQNAGDGVAERELDRADRDVLP